jgi:hypothetical protein
VLLFVILHVLIHVILSVTKTFCLRLSMNNLKLKAIQDREFSSESSLRLAETIHPLFLSLYLAEECDDISSNSTNSSGSDSDDHHQGSYFRNTPATTAVEDEDEDDGNSVDVGLEVENKYGDDDEDDEEFDLNGAGKETQSLIMFRELYANKRGKYQSSPFKRKSIRLVFGSGMQQRFTRMPNVKAMMQQKPHILMFLKSANICFNTSGKTPVLKVVVPKVLNMSGKRSSLALVQSSTEEVVEVEQ